MRLLTLNTLFKGDVRARLRALAAHLAATPYDVVCLQEVLTRGGARLLAELAPAYTHRRYHGIPILKGGLVLLSRRPVVSCSFTRFPVTGPARPERLMRKGAQVAVLETPAGRLAVVNTHLSANRDDDWSPANRWTAVARAELTHLAGAVAALDPAMPVVVTGDLNVPRDAAVLADFRAATGLTDAMAGDPRPTYRPTPQWPAPPAFDHVLVRGATAACRLVFEEERVPLRDGRSVYLSDHYGIEADLTLSAG
ncbi:endonuclease/exonuclease/phosphatase family protein [Dactylosporangium sp. NPDC005572]|uniref:endonuclease/exonuclease/phosphatase family protein n=1 Tax=Dactylosporangium sp. NPDC005572 TaxID=3156889 RepID=UPI0033AE603F